jgi:hypothetical protein
VVAVAVAVPFTEAVQLLPSKPPAGMVSEYCNELPVNVPEIVPCATLFPVVSVTAAVPDTAVPLWVNCHVMRPGPDESLALPVHVPVRLSDAGGGVDGALGDDLPPQAIVATVHAAASVAAMGTASRRIRLCIT